jgi:NTP pyrophosphatase (non-canonical NTP hydrolase)
MMQDIDKQWSIPVWCARVHRWAISKGWWEQDKVKSFGEIIALIHSEASEALEEHRNGHAPQEIYYTFNGMYSERKLTEQHKPEGIPIEMADIVIRVMDYCEREGIDLEAAMHLKMEYNYTRPHRHGDKKL